MTESKTEPRQRHVWAVVYAKGNQRRTRGLYSSQGRADAAVKKASKADQPHLELEQMPINGPA
jgi:hypothetical protein